MYEVLRTTAFSNWLAALEDRTGRIAVLSRLDRLALGNVGDTKAVGAGVSELRIDVGPGYRVYFMRVGARVYVVLAGGAKRTQAADIKRAVVMATELKAASPSGAARRSR